jgi:endoglucanase
MHYNLFTLPIEEEPVAGTDTWLDRGFEMVDQLVTWCQTHEIYLVLDLHAAPGGQGRDANISDYDSSKPSLWESEENRRKTVALWGRLAERYANQDWIGGYDLINEPNWGFDAVGGNNNGCNESSNSLLKELTDAIVEQIRVHDTNHLIFIEGNCWGNNHSNLWPIDDDNVALSFHRYWIDNTYDTISRFVDLGETYDVPIWMGESGENNNQWYFDAVELLEQNNIGWAWWTWKKLQSDSGSYSVTPPNGYQTLLDYWANGGTRPDQTFAFNVMMELTENLLLENCTRNSGAIDALTQGHD